MSEANGPTAASAGPDGPGPDERPRRRHRRVTRRGVEQEVLPGPSVDEESTGWSEGTESAGDSNDARLTRDVPPHW